MTGNAALRNACPLRRAIRRIGPWTTALLMFMTSVAAFAHSIEAQVDRRIIVAIAEKPDAIAGSGSSARGYAGLPDYAGSQRTRAAARRIADAHGLVEIAAWTIEPLQLRCMLYEVPASSSREEMLDRLRADRRVKLAEPLRIEHKPLQRSVCRPAEWILGDRCGTCPAMGNRQARFRRGH